MPGPGLKRVDETILALSFDCEEQEARQWDGRTRSMLSLPVVATIQEATLQVTDSRVSTLTVKLTGLQGLEPNGLLNRTVKSPPTRR